jgi:hypothetical protein
LDKLSLALLEQACLLDPVMLELLWQRITADMLVHSAVWPGGAVQTAMKSTLEQSSSHKALCRKFQSLRRAIYPPQLWRPWISQTSLSTLAVNPFPRDRTDLNLGCQASVPIAVGAFHGQALVVGIGIHPEGPLEDNICVGIEAFDPDSSVTMSIMIAPMSGHCFIHNSIAGFGIWSRAAALPALGFVPETLRIWIELTKTGAVRFLRQVEGIGLEDAGTIGPEQLPCAMSEYYPCLHVWGYNLKAAAKVSVDYAAVSFPKYFTDKPASKMEGVWEVWQVLNEAYAARLARNPLAG